MPLPRHIAVIMDGNGRYAKKRFLPRIMGHKFAVERVRELIQNCHQKNIEVLTLFAFSSENWKRPQEEIGFLMRLMLESLKKETQAMHANNIQVKIIGDHTGIAEEILEVIHYAQDLTEMNTGLKLRIAFNYGGRHDIVMAAKALANEVINGKINLDDINLPLFSSFVANADVPDPDLLIRTSGEQRISNFMLWQCAYTELYFTEALFPEFDSRELEKALSWYSERERRFGRISEQLAQQRVEEKHG